ncbi:hypothetical protein Tco_1307172 [Tanacetum coccineum]
MLEELEDLSFLDLDELIGNLKVHEVVMKKDFKIYKDKKERVKSIALKAKKESSDDETLTSGSDDEEYVMASPSCKIGLGFDKSKASTSETKPISFVESSMETTRDESTLKADGSTIPGSVDPSTSQKVAKQVFSPLISSQSDFVIIKKKLIHNSIENSKRPTLKPSLKNGLGYVKKTNSQAVPMN